MSGKIRTAEFVSPKHPDKICDRLAGAVVDEFLRQDPLSRVALEIQGGHHQFNLTGEVISHADVDIPRILREFDDAAYATYTANLKIVGQSPEIKRGVDRDGAGDQGTVLGYACSETSVLVPLEYFLARDLCREIYSLHPFDGKTQVTINMESGEILCVVASFQNVSGEELTRICRAWAERQLLGTGDAVFMCNPAGDWQLGGLDADSGVVGRKLVVDHYGIGVPIGGGAVAGKDPSKSDVYGALFSRFIARELLERGIGSGVREVRVNLAFAIGMPQPVQATATIDGLQTNIAGDYDFRPSKIIESLHLRTPFYERLAGWGQLGHPSSPWG
jgi:S-adenosylmethionine synthetase